MLCVTVICTLTICFASPALDLRWEMTHKREFYRKCPEIAVFVTVLIVEDWMWCDDPSPTLGSRAALVLKPASMRLHLVDFHRELFARGSACTICFFIRRWVCWNWDECTLLSTVPSNMCALTLPWHLIATFAGWHTNLFQNKFVPTPPQNTLHLHSGRTLRVPLTLTLASSDTNTTFRKEM